MDFIRSLVSEFINNERILLEQRKGDFRENRTQLTTLLFMQILVFIFLALLTFAFISRNLFMPLKFLLNSTYKMECGEKLEVTDIVRRDEMGYLLSRFYVMNEIVHSRTKELNFQANHDGLTGLKNRKKLLVDLLSMTSKAEKSGYKVAVIYLDLNKFKQLNDTLGHDAGDAVLKETAVRLQDNTRKNDGVFRLGGDEFVVLLSQIKTTEQIKTIIEKIQTAFNQEIMIQGMSKTISISAGIAIAPDHSTNPDKLLKMADVAMYSAKQDVERNYCFFETNMFKRADDAI